MRICIFGAGYVGLVTAACFAELGNHVSCVDVNEARIEQLSHGKCPIHEPGLTELIIENLKAGRLIFTTNPTEAMNDALFIFIAVGTPSSDSGACDLSYVFKVAQCIGENLQRYAIIIDKSTVPVGTADKVKTIVQKELDRRQVKLNFDVASNPEFLREGDAIKDFMQSDRIIIGTETDTAKNHLLALYAHFNRNGDRVICMDPRSSELTKYAANAMLATRISFINELSRLAESVGADIEFVRRGIGSDPRIGISFLNPGCGYGGSCFPKDIQALEYTAVEANLDLFLIKAVHSANEHQKQVLFKKINAYFNGNLENKTIALWGLSFKPDTDDMREAPSRVLIEALWKAKAKVRVYDPVAYHETIKLYGHRPDLVLCNTPEDALTDADALAIATEWKIFASPNFELMKTKLKNPVIFDGRNLYDPAYLKALGFHYYGIGRGETI